MQIEYFNRNTQRVEVERVYGENALKWLYTSFLGRFFSWFLTHPFPSRLYGHLQSSALSKRKIAPFIKNFGISMDDFLPSEGRGPSDPYSSFNEFFIRRFKEGRRIFVQGEKLSAFSEARYFGHEFINAQTAIPVKGKFLTASQILNHPHWCPFFEAGSLLVARLCPVDYHRFHFPDNGKILDFYRIKGVLHSVNPLALKKRPDIFMMNERQVSILETENFGKLAYIEVGAVCVGKICQSFTGENFSRGQEKGYFLFGGSTVLVFGERGKWKPSQDIIENTQRGLETYLHLGTEAGIKVSD